MNQPNIIMVMTDQHNGAVVHSMGDPWVRTPNMDYLANNGAVFCNASCNSPLCVPSRSSMLSGLMPHQTGIFNNAQSLPSDKVTFVHSLASSGYETVLSGRMHFNGPDQRHGYEQRFVGDITTAALGISFSKERYGYFDNCAMPGRLSVERSGKGECAVMAFDHDVTNAACKYLETRCDKRPIFLTVGLYGPHPPYVGSADLYDYYYDVLPDPEPLTSDDYENAHPFEKEFMKIRRVGHETAEEIKRVRAAYYSMVEFEDSLLGKIINVAEKTLDMNNTIIMYISDHGDSIGYHGLFWKSNLREGAVKIPMLFYWKGHIPEKTVIRGLASLVDIAPTLLELASAPMLPVMDGESLVKNLLTGDEIRHDKVVISEICDIKGDAPGAMIRKKNFKYCKYYGYSEPQLFDLDNDPEEKRNLCNDSAHQNIINYLREELNIVWDENAIYNQRLICEKEIALRLKWAKTPGAKLFYDEWKQIGRERNRNFLLVNGEKIDD